MWMSVPGAVTTVIPTPSAGTLWDPTGAAVEMATMETAWLILVKVFNKGNS